IYSLNFMFLLFFLSSRRRHTRSKRDWSSDVCSSDLTIGNISFANALVAVKKRAPNPDAEIIDFFLFVSFSIFSKPFYLLHQYMIELVLLLLYLHSLLHNLGLIFQNLYFCSFLPLYLLLVTMIFHQFRLK